MKTDFISDNYYTQYSKFNKINCNKVPLLIDKQMLKIERIITGKEITFIGGKNLRVTEAERYSAAKKMRKYKNGL